MQSHEEISTIFCNNVFLPPTTTSHWRIDSNNITHYDGCCPIYNQIIQKEREEHIKTYMYLSKINKWVCPHTKEYYEQKIADSRGKLSEEDLKRSPPPLNLSESWPDCCMHDLNLTLSRTQKRVQDKVYNIEDALNDPNVDEQYKVYLSKIN
jgi:hypothetical protein